MREAGILLDKEERKASIVEQVNQTASLVGGEAIIEEGLLSEVANLVEMPTAVMGGFDQEYLSLPRDVCVHDRRVEDNVVCKEIVQSVRVALARDAVPLIQRLDHHCSPSV